MNWRAIRAIVQRDLLVAMRSKFVMLPLIFVPLAIVVVLPLAIGLGMGIVSSFESSAGDVEEMLAMLPPEMAGQFAQYTGPQAVLVLFLRYTFAPLYLILPLMTATVIAADSFAGEKERKTIEALVYTPTSDLELLVAKLLGGWVTGVAVAWGSFLVYCVTTNLAAWPTLHQIFMPDAMWLVLAIWVAPAAAGLGLAATVLASARVNSFQEAYQLGGLVILPVMTLLLAQVAGVMYVNVSVALLLGAILWVVDGVLIWLGAKTVRRGELLAKL